jgi:putative transcriptional regulator
MNLNGSLLIAPPAMQGTFWNKSVILVTDDYEAGSIGLILNKPSDMSIADFGDRVDFELNYPGYIYLGGPIDTQKITMLHTNEWSCANTRRINGQLSISSAEDMFIKLENRNTPKRWRIFAGTCGWAPNQLAAEIKGLPPCTHEKSWCTATSSHNLIFDTDNNIQWELALSQSAIDFARDILA